MPILLTVVAIGCTEWPRFAHVDDSNANILPAGSDISDSLQVAWTELDPEVEPYNDEPDGGGRLKLGEGWLTGAGSLDGWGWDPYSDPDHDTGSICGDPIVTPTEMGVYTGDVDWFPVRPQSNGTLCAELTLTPEEDAEPVYVDLLLFEVNECLDLIGVFTEPNADGEEEAIGWTAPGNEVRWSVRVESATQLGILVAGVLPQDDALTVDRKLAVSLVDTGNAGQAGDCPTVPESAW